MTNATRRHLGIVWLALWAQVAAAAPREVSHAEAARQIGRGVLMATGSAMPAKLVPLMREHALSRDGRTNVFYMATFAGANNFTPEVADKWHPNLLFVSKPNRAAATHAASDPAQRRATLYRSSLFQLGQKIERDKLPIDTVVVRVSPPDAEGNVSLGTSGDVTLSAVKSVLRRGGKIIAEVNPNVPHMKGNRIPYDALSFVTHEDELLIETNPIVPQEIEKTIAAHVAQLVPDHATLQVGIGNALAGIGDQLKGKPLTIWSEMGPAGLLALANAPDSKVDHATFSFLHADNGAYQAAARNPRITMGSSVEVNDPKTIAGKPRMVAINTALEVDLLGNVNAERNGDKIISFPGGQPDFMEGASSAADGAAILALRSTAAAAGGVSTVVAGLKGPTTTPKHHVDYVVTEWGATSKLRDQPDEVRAFQIISVAHPFARADLAKAAQARGLLSAAQVHELVAGIYSTIRKAPADHREALAVGALERGLITQDQMTKIVVELLSPKVD